MKYFVSIGERVVEVEVDGTAVMVDGIRHEAHLEAVPGTPEHRLVLDDLATMVAVDGYRDGAWRLVEQGAVRDVGIEDERSRHIRGLVGTGGGAAAGGALKAPMPGLVVRVAVAVGDVVAPGSPLVVLEAMKMENELKATAAGVVVAVRVEVGTAVEKGVVLLELGPAS